MRFNYVKKQADLGLLIIRLGVGIPFILLHGWPKVIAGADRWIGLGERFGMVTGFELFPIFWGFLAAFSEFIGGILLTAGWFTRPACFFLFFTMIIATAWHIMDGSGYSHSLILIAVFAGLFFIGPGKYSFDKK